MSNRMRDDDDIDQFRRIADTCAAHGVNGILLSAGFGSIDTRDQDGINRLEKVREISRETGVEIIPSMFSTGYGGAFTSHDRNLAAGQPVNDALYVVRGGKAQFAADPPVAWTTGTVPYLRL